MASSPARMTRMEEKEELGDLNNRLGTPANEKRKTRSKAECNGSHVVVMMMMVVDDGGGAGGQWR